ncbi:MAG: hypothetical protein K2P10_07085 [Oscillospiraceae bacterium]|jgi:hypothetical protein|nr:hypothetical protein [Oscillospiraceae bacterium]
MKKVIFALSFLLLLSACGREEKNDQIAVLQAENAAYQEQISALEAENVSLRDQLKEQQDTGEETDPITSFFETVECDGSTVSMNIVAGSKADAWESEARHLAEELKDQLPLQEDRDLVDAYLHAVEEQVERMNIIAVYPVSDVSIPCPDRLNTTGTLRGVLWAGSRSKLWQDAFNQLRFALPDYQEYIYLFDTEKTEQELAEALQ